MNVKAIALLLVLSSCKSATRAGDAEQKTVGAPARNEAPPRRSAAAALRPAVTTWQDDFQYLHASNRAEPDKWFLQQHFAPNAEEQVYEDFLHDDPRTTTHSRGVVCRGDGPTSDGACAADAWTYKIESDALADDGFALRLRAVRRGGKIYSARLNSKRFQEHRPRAGAGLGISARIRFSEGLIDVASSTAAWPAFWLLGRGVAEAPLLGDGDSTSWPCPDPAGDNGAQEIDIMEQSGVMGPRKNHSALHFGTVPCSGPAQHKGLAVDDESRVFADGRYHTYAVEWQTTQIRFLADGAHYGGALDTSALHFDDPMFVILNLAVGGTLGNRSEPLSPTQLAVYDGDGQSVYVDWVRVEEFAASARDE